MKSRILITLFLSIMTTVGYSADYNIKLEKPNLKRGKSMMETLSQRQSTREYSNKEVSLTDLSDLLWAANGVNREDGKRTAPSAMNQQEITVYAFLKSGTYKYDFKNHTLELVAKGDNRKLVVGTQGNITGTPIFLVYVADVSKLSRFGDRNLVIASMDTGIVSQNVNLFCASVGMATVPRITMNIDGIKELLNLSNDNVPLMNNAIGYQK